MRDVNAEIRSGERRRQHLAAIAEHEHEVGTLRDEVIGHRTQHVTRGARHRRGIIALQVDGNTRGDAQTGRRDGVDGVAVFRHEMHAGGAHRHIE